MAADIAVKVGMDAAEFRAGAQRMGVSVQNVGKRMDPLRMSLSQLSRESRRVWRETRTPMERYTMEVQRLAVMHRRGAIDAETFNRAVAQSRQRFQQATQAANVHRRNIGGLVDQVKRLAAGYLGLYAAVRTATAAIRTTEQVNQALASSMAILPEVTDELREDMKRTAYEVAFDTKFSAKETAAAFYFLESAGLDVQRSMLALPKVAKFAQAGMFDLSTATSLLTDAQSALGMKSKDAVQNMRNLVYIGDLLVKANTLADASVHEFAEALAGPLAGALRANNRSLVEGISLLALLAERGQKGAEASQAANVLFRDIPRAIARNRAAFEEYGITLTDVRDNMLPMATMVANLTEGLQRLSDVERAAAFENLGLTRSVRDVIMKLFEGSGELRDFGRELRNVEGITERVADRQLPALTKGWHQFTTAIGEAAHALLDLPLQDVGEWLSLVGKRLSRAGEPAEAIQHVIRRGIAEAAESPELAIFKRTMAEAGAILFQPPSESFQRIGRMMRGLTTGTTGGPPSVFAQPAGLAEQLQTKPTADELKQIAQAATDGASMLGDLRVAVQQVGWSQSEKDAAAYADTLRKAGRYSAEAMTEFRGLQRQLEATTRQQREAAETRRTFRDWQRQIRDFGMTARERVMRDLAQKVDFKSPIWMFTPQGEQFEAFRNLDRELSRLEQRASDIRAGERLREQFVTPAQEAAEEFRLLRRLIEIGPAEGGFDLGMAQQVIDRRTMERMRDMAPATVGFKEAGSREAYSAILRHQYGGRDKLLDTANKQLIALERIATKVEEEGGALSTTSVRVGRER